MFRSTVLTLSWWLMVLILSGFIRAQQTTPAPAVVHEPDWIDKVLGIVGPSEPKHLTEKERFQQYLLFVAGPLPLLGEAAGSGINQWTNTPPEWGQGSGAYGKRLGSNLAYNAVRQTITYASSIPLDEDSRYFASHRRGLTRRVGFALISTVTAKKSDDRRVFSFSSVAGVVGASAISSIWGPPSFKGPGNIAGNAGITFGVTAAFNIVREFLPDLLHRPTK